MPEVKSKIKSTKLKLETKKVAVAKVVKPKTVEKRVFEKAVNLSIPVYTLSGEENGILSLPEGIFGQKVNKKLLAQAVRVYSTNEKFLTGSTKTRGEVRGSTIKIYRQKGTGRARHGGIRAPIFVGGGIVFGPSPRKVTLDLSKRMKRAALISALSSKVSEKNAIGISGLEKISGKTKEFVNFLEKTLKNGKKIKSTLIITGEKMDNVFRSVKNIQNITTLPFNLINTYQVIKHEALVLTKEAVEKLASAINNPESSEKTVKTVKEKTK